MDCPRPRRPPGETERARVGRGPTTRACEDEGEGEAEADVSVKEGSRGR